MPEAKEHDYQNRIRAQIAQYANPGGLIQLGPIYHYWISKHIQPRIAQVFGVYDALLFYAQYKVEALRQRGASRRIVSLGAGDCMCVFGNNDRIFFSGHPRIKVSWGKQQVLPNSFRRRSRAHRTFCRCLLKNLPSVVFWVLEICRTYLSTGVLAII